jgi:hypothetical protein
VGERGGACLARRRHKDGRAKLYLYPDQRQYIGAHDWSGKYRLKGHQVLKAKPGQTVDELVVTMEPVEQD